MEGQVGTVLLCRAFNKTRGLCYETVIEHKPQPTPCDDYAAAAGNTNFAAFLAGGLPPVPLPLVKLE